MIVAKATEEPKPNHLTHAGVNRQYGRRQDLSPVRYELHGQIENGLGCDSRDVHQTGICHNGTPYNIFKRIMITKGRTHLRPFVLQRNELQEQEVEEAERTDTEA